MREEKEKMPQATLFSGVHFGGGHGGHDMKVGASVLIIDFYRSQSTVLHKNVLCKVDFRYTRERTDTAGDISLILLHGPQT